MKNYTEFRRVADLLIKKLTFTDDLNVSVFESNIRGKRGSFITYLKKGISLTYNGCIENEVVRVTSEIDTKNSISKFSCNSCEV